VCCCRAFCRTHFLVLGKNLFYIEKEGGKLERFEIYEWHVLYRNSEQSCCCCCKRRGNNSFKFLSRDFCEPERANASFPARAKHHAISRQPRALTQHTHTHCALQQLIPRRPQQCSSPNQTDPRYACCHWIFLWMIPHKGCFLDFSMHERIHIKKRLFWWKRDQHLKWSQFKITNNMLSTWLIPHICRLGILCRHQGAN
jgi:hypothetical protein